MPVDQSVVKSEVEDNPVEYVGVESVEIKLFPEMQFLLAQMKKGEQSVRSKVKFLHNCNFCRKRLTLFWILFLDLIL